MGALAEQIDSHDFWQNFQNVEARLAEIDGACDDEPNHIELLERIDRIVQEVRRRVDSLDRILLTVAQLNPLAQHAAQLNTELRKYSPKAPAHLGAANSHATNLLAGLQGLPFLSSDAAASMGEAVSTFRRSIAQHIRHASADLDELRAKVEQSATQLDGIEQNITTEKGRIDTFVGEAQERFNAAEVKRAEKLEESVAAAKKRTEDRLSELNTDAKTLVDDLEANHDAASAKFDEALEEKKQKWLDALEEDRGKFASALETAESQAKSAGEKAEEDAQAIIVALQEQKDKAMELVGMVANTSMAGGYKIVADAQLKEAKKWSNLTVGSLIAVIAFLGLTFAFGSDKFSWFSLLRKLPITASCILLAGYSAQQASRNKKLEARNRRFELELASLDPFLATLPESERGEIKKLLAGRLFGTPETDESASDSVTPKNVLDLAQSAIKRLK